MILNEDKDILIDAEKVIDLEKNLKKDLKHWVNWFISSKEYYPKSIVFNGKNSNKKFRVDTTIEVIDKIKSKVWFTDNLLKHGPVVTRKISAQLIIDDLFINIRNYLVENNLNYYDYKMSYKDVYWRWS